jgi:rubredoxin
MRCAFCGLEFNLEQAEEACSACPLVRGCHLIRCPRCGYEMPPEAKLLTYLRRLRKKATSSFTFNHKEGHHVD